MCKQSNRGFAPRERLCTALEENIDKTASLPSADSDGDTAPLTADTDKTKKQRGKKQRGFKEKLQFLWRDKRRFSARLLTALCAAFAFAFTFFIFGPFDIYCNNMQFFVFGVKYMVWPVVLVGLAVFAGLTGLLCLLKGKIFNYAVSLVFSLTAAGYIQGNLLNADHGTLDGTPVVWSDFKASALLGLLFWAVVILVPIVIQYFSRKAWKVVVRLVSLMIVGAQTVALVVVVATTCFTNVSDNGYFKKDTIYEVSPENNVIVFVFDRFDKRYADAQFEKDPKLEDMFKGFTFYENFTGSYSRTFPSLTYLLTGLRHKYDIPSDDYFKEAWGGQNIVRDIKDAGYETKLYTDVKYVVGNTENVKDLASNVAPPTHAANPRKILSALHGLSAYRYMPECLKLYYHMDTSDISYSYIYGDDGTNDIYDLNDEFFYGELREKGVSLKSGSKGSFIFYHLRCSHGPYTMDEDGHHCSYMQDRDDARFRQERGDLNMLKMYLELLKEQGVYDKSTIIVTADHGETGRITDLKEEKHTRFPALFIKPANAKDEQMRRSGKQVCQDNLRASILSYFGLDYKKYLSPCPEYSYPRTIEEIGEDEDMVRYFWMSASAAKNLGKRDKKLVTYEIRGDANDLDNYTEISRETIEVPYYKD